MLFSKSNFKTLLLAGALVSSVVALSACGGVVAPSVTSGTAPTVRSVSVNGQGVATAKPDLATINVGIETTGTTVQDATTNNEQIMQKILEALKGQNIEDKDIQTSNYSLWVDQRYDDQGNITGIAGYRVSNDLVIVVRDLNNLGIVLQSVTDAGANKVYGISFGIADMTKLREQAREQAVADAKARAEALAKLTGNNVGLVINISESYSGGNPVPVMYEARMDMAAGNAAPSISAGQLNVTVDVNVTYELK